MSRFIAPRPQNTLVLRTCKPRNPLALAARQRQAGTHRPAHARQQAAREMREQLKTLDSP